MTWRTLDHMTSLVEIGVLTRPHGIRGELCLNYYAESLDLLRSELFLQAGQCPPRKVRVTQVRMHHGQPVISLEGVTDRSMAEQLRGQILLVAETALPPLEEDEFYLHELLGFAVEDKDSATPLGVLNDVHFYGEQEVWAIRTADGKEFLLPAVPEFVIEIDTNARLIRVTPPQGLLEVYGITLPDLK